MSELFDTQGQILPRDTDSEAQLGRVLDYIVLTAAVTRPDLHKTILPGAVNFLEGASVHWIVNIDPVVGGATVEKTAEQYIEAVRHYPSISIEVLPSPLEGCFFRASRALALRAETWLPACQVGVVWLEDDWIFHQRSIGQRLLGWIRHPYPLLSRCAIQGARGIGLAAKTAALKRLSQTGNGLWFVSLVPRKLVSFNPGIWSKKLFAQHVIASLKAESSQSINDPETLCADPVNQPKVSNGIRTFVDPLCQDAGREWGARAGLQKWNKQAHELQANGRVSYVARYVPTQIAEDLGEEKERYLMIGGEGRRFPFRVLLRLCNGPKGLSLRPVGAPYPVFRVVPQGEGAAELYTEKSLPWARTYPFKLTKITMPWPIGQVPSPTRVETPRGLLLGEWTSSRPRGWQLLWLLQAVLGAAMLVCSWVYTLSGFDRG